MNKNKKTLMKFYHGTSEENWKKIQQEHVLWGISGDIMKTPRHTHLYVKKEDAMKYEVVLEVEYEPYQEDRNGRVDDYKEGVTSFKVRRLIRLRNVKKIEKG